ncbi:MAG: PilZ domain-containing protein [Desulfuromonadaceae bacterium]|nr:PilZ domain-containing protein [Desulfuromonadaceae bacterium]
MSGRSFTRVNHSVVASIMYEGSTVTGKTDNLSIRGMFVKTDIDLPLNAPVHIKVNSSKNSFFNFNANVVRKGVNGVGLQINSISANSFALLRDIVSEKSCDYDQIMSETYEMIKCIY